MNEQETIEAMRKAYNFGKVAGPLQDPMELAYAVARESVLDEVIAELSTKAVRIEGTPYSCGPRRWSQFVEDMKGPNP